MAANIELEKYSRRFICNGDSISITNTIETAHEDMIHDAQLNFFGTRLATCSSDCTIKIFEIVNNAQKYIATLKGHEGPVWQIAWAHPSFGHILASCSYDKKVIIWSELNGKWENLYEHILHKSSVNSICWAPYVLGLILACGSSDGDISILSSLNSENTKWDIQKIENAHDLGCNAVSWSPVTACGALLSDGKDYSELKYIKQFVSGGCDNAIKIWKESEGKWCEDAVLEGHTDWVRDVAWAPSIGISDHTIASCSQDKKVIIWTNNGTSKTWTSKVIHTFDDVIWHVSWSITGSLLAVSCGDNTVSIWQEDVNGNWLCISDEMTSPDENEAN